MSSRSATRRPTASTCRCSSSAGADVTPSADTPCLLTGYGGFSIAATPAYSPIAIAVAEAGGMFADACIRGGAEEGEDWHRAGMREHKQQVFDDFHAAGDWLVSNGLTSRGRLALRGGSNGGLLMGAAMTQRPDLARAIHCAVPLLDMVRYHLHLIGKLWTPEYGDPDVAEELEWVLAYSPYHHVVPGTCYPAVLFTAAEGDGRVDPNHARKMTAAVQWATSCGDEHPILLRQEDRAGHGAGKPLAKQADELADVLAFLWWQLGVVSDGLAHHRGARGGRVHPTTGAPPGSPSMPTTESSSAPSRSGSKPTAIRASRRGRCALRCPRRSTASRRRPRRPTSPTPPRTRTTSSRSTTSSCSPPISIARSTRSPSKGSSCAASAKGPAGDGREVKQAFFRMAEVILEVVATGRGGDEPAQFWGLTFLSDDLDATLAALGPDRVSEARAAVQTGRRIATVRESAGLGVPVALMDR